MNNSEFVQMVLSLTDEEVATAGLKSPAAVIAICLTLATYGDYKTGTGVQPTWTTVAKKAHVSRTTAHKVRDWLIANGVLEETGKTAPLNGRPGNVSIYRFGPVVQRTWTPVVVHPRKTTVEAGTYEQLSIQEPQLSIWEPQLSIVGGHNTTLDTTSNTTNTKDSANATSTTSSNFKVKEGVEEESLSQSSPNFKRPQALAKPYVFMGKTYPSREEAEAAEKRMKEDW